ncbi:single-stranded DNA-binding protein [Mycoplasma buteonis]|uniref:single-stranded DNA-binding protein n=1 Tax=Mycoplasma buteonis TaxID=171280 RepID=UPI000689B15A|nr:single-stranded DNA-binding protein [Mycoplasma buteonis]
MINNVVLVGRLTATPTVASTSNGIPYVRFSIAITRRNSGQNQITDFINLVAWRNTADYIGQYATKGALVAVEGELHSNVYNSTVTNTPVRNVEVSVTNFRLLESREVMESRNNTTNNYKPNNQKGFTPNSTQNNDINTDFSQLRSVKTSENIFDDLNEDTPEVKHQFDSLFSEFDGIKVSESEK